MEETNKRPLVYTSLIIPVFIVRPREVRSEFSVRPFSESDAENFQYSILNIFPYQNLAIKQDKIFTLPRRATIKMFGSILMRV